MNIILFGPQGCGKGTQAELLTKKLGILHLSMGDALRLEIKNSTDIGRKVEAIMKKGDLVPYTITNAIALKYSKDKKSKNGMLLDGYPRSIEQWLFVKENIKIDAAIEITLPAAESVKRISSRRMCPKCNRNYNVISLKPKREGYCDDDGTKLITREDDTPKAVRERLKIYQSQTEPLKKEYKKLGILFTVDGKQSIEKVHKDILKQLKIK